MVSVYLLSNVHLQIYKTEKGGQSNGNLEFKIGHADDDRLWREDVTEALHNAGCSVKSYSSVMAAKIG